jgi:two-component sensor histidine kinase
VEGFIYAPFRARDLLEAALSEAELKTIGVTVYVGEETPDTLLFSNDEAPGEGNLHVIQVANMDWLLRLHPHDELLSGWLAPSKLILFFGVLVSLLSALIARGQTQKLRASNALSTERLARAEDRDLMLREITHRMKNAIARIQSIAQLSANNSQTVDSYVNTFVGRLQAMANAQDLLTQTRWKSSGLRALLETEIGQIVDTNSENVSLSGPTVHLDGGQAQAVGLVVHELATNASKYGAFKQGGKVDINWAVKKHDEGAQFDLVWRETGLTNRPDLSRKGFGTDLAALMIDGQMKGKFSRRIDSGDLVIRIGFPYTLE